MSLSGAHTITFNNNGIKQKYLFDKNSMDVEFIKYVKNKVVCEKPRIEEIIELWRIKSLNKEIEVKRTLKYKLVTKKVERRDWKPFGHDSIDTMNKSNYGDDTYIEWSPEILNNSKNRKYIEKYYVEGCNNKYNNEDNKTMQDLIFINTNIPNQLGNLEKYNILISKTNRISNVLTKINRNRKLPGLLPIAKTYIDNNLDTNSRKDKLSNTMVNDIAKTTNHEFDDNGLFIPVHRRSGFRNMMRTRRYRNNNDSNNDSNNEGQNLFRVRKREDQPRFIFVVKGIPDPQYVINTDILDALCNTSHTLRENPKAASIVILKDKQTRKQKNMCLVIFNKEEVKNKVLQECQSSRVLFNNCILSVEDGNNN